MRRAVGGLDHRARGRLGERAATRWLEQRGYRIVERNYSCRHGEIDVIAEHRDVLCFIEVKMRASAQYGRAIEAMSHGKRRRVARTAAFYLAEHPTDRPCRFDVVAMDLDGGDWHFELVVDAFQLA